jgi:PAS domain S-box-containing protein
MQERLARRQVEVEQRQSGSRLTRDEAKLRDTQEAYHILVDRSLQGLLILQDQQIVFANQAVADLTGHRMDELATATLEQAITFVHPDDQAMLRQRHADRLQGRPTPARYEFRTLHADGGLRWLEIHAGVIEYRGRPAVQVALTDITAHKQTQLALRHSEEQFQAVFAQAPAMVGIIDTEGRWTYMNHHMADSLGYSSAELAHLRVGDLTDPRDREQTLVLIARLLRGEIDHFRVEKRYVRKDGGVLWADLSVSPIHGQDGRIEALIGAGMDITDRKRSENLTEIQRDLAVNLGPIEDLREGLHLCLRVAIGAAGLDCGGIYLRDETSGAMELLCHTGLSEDFVQRVSHYDRDTANVQLTMTGEPIYANYTKLELPPDVIESREALQAIAVVPLVHRKQVIGCLNVASHSLTEVPHYSRIALETIAGQISGTIARLRAEQALRESEERIGNLIRHSSSMFYTHTPDHVLTYVSPQSRDIMGCEPEQARTHWQEYLSDHPGNIQGIEATGRAIQTGQRQPPYELELITRQGRRIWVRVDEGPVVQDGKTVAIVGSITDITERKQAEEALRESEERFRATFEQVAVGVAHVGLDGRWLRVNQKLCDIVGYRTDELLARTFQDITHPDDLNADLVFARQVLAGEIATYSMEKRYIRKQGSLVWINLTVSLVREPSGKPKYFIGVVEDISERKKSQEALQQSEEKFSKVFRASPALISISTLSNGRMLDVNESLAQAAGFPRQEIIGRTSSELGFWANPEERERLAQRLAAGRSVRDWDCRFRVRDGRIILTRYSAEVVEIGGETCILSVFVDVTERKQAEEALRISEERFRTLFEAAPDAIYLTDVEGNLVDANKAAEQLVGRARHELIGKNLLEVGLLPEGQIPRATANLKANAMGKATGPEEYTLRRNDGVCLAIEIRSFPIRIENRTLVLGVARDITEHKFAEKRAREHQEQLLHISRLGTLGEMASGFAHELNQPLSAILSYASAAQRSVKPQALEEELLRRDLDQVIAQTKRAGEIVKRVRAFVQQRPALLRPTHTNDIIREALAFLHFDVLHKEIQVVLDLGEGLPRVQADAIQLEQALLNLVRNAIEAMETMEPPERRLTIRTTVQDANTVKVTVSDTGPGLPPEIKDQVFNPFVTTKPNGLGVGLSITRTIIELHRGQLWVEPGDGRGCTFVFTLPVAVEDSTTLESEHR